MKPWPYPTRLENLAWSALIELEAVRAVHGVAPHTDASIRGLRAELEYLLDLRWERPRARRAS